MDYRIEAHKGKIGSIISIGDEVIPTGSFYESGELYVICLRPMGEKKLPEEPVEEKKKPEDASTINLEVKPEGGIS